MPVEVGPDSHASDLILPLFVRPGKGVRQEIGSMPGNFQLSVDTLVDEIGAARELGLKSFMLFGIPEFKDPTGSSALQDAGIVQQAIRSVRKAFGSDVFGATFEMMSDSAKTRSSGTSSTPTSRANAGSTYGS